MFRQAQHKLRHQLLGLLGMSGVAYLGTEAAGLPRERQGPLPVAFVSTGSTQGCA
jgi:hypothetical protein